MKEEPTICVVDGDPAVRNRMTSLFKSAAINSCCYKSPVRLLNALQPDHPGCIVLELRLPGMNGLDLQAALRDKHCNQPVIFITGHGDIKSAVLAIRAGAIDFLTKPVDDATLLNTVREAIDQDQNLRLANKARGEIAGRLASLTPREREVFDYVIRGLSNKEIACELGISHKTVEVHRAHMMGKMDALTIASLVQIYLLDSNVGI